MTCDECCSKKAAYTCGKWRHTRCTDCNPQKIWFCPDCDRRLYVIATGRPLRIPKVRDKEYYKYHERKEFELQLEILHPLLQHFYGQDTPTVLKITEHKTLIEPNDDEWKELLSLIPSLGIDRGRLTIHNPTEITLIPFLVQLLCDQGWEVSLSAYIGHVTFSTALPFSWCNFEILLQANVMPSL